MVGIVKTLMIVSISRKYFQQRIGDIKNSNSKLAITSLSKFITSSIIVFVSTENLPLKKVDKNVTASNCIDLFKKGSKQWCLRYSTNNHV